MIRVTNISNKLLRLQNFNRSIKVSSSLSYLKHTESFIIRRNVHFTQKNQFKLSEYYLTDINPDKVKVSSKSSTIPSILSDSIDEVISKDNSIKSSSLHESNTAISDLKQTQQSENSLKPIVKKTIYQKIKDEVVHYYHGFRLLFLDIKVCCGIMWKLCKGNTLSRRERKQLVRTVADLFRTLPFAVFVVVPFMEFLLPFYIKFFPFMMPSTFNSKPDKSVEIESNRQMLKGKLEMAKFLQDTLDETDSLYKIKKDGDMDLETFNKFIKQVREAGHTASTRDIVKFSRLFEDEMTLESLETRMLKALCKLLELNSIGPRTLLVLQLRMRVHQLRADDRMIAKEGVDSLPVYELISLCRERGMRAIGVSHDRLRFQLSQWLKLSIRDEVPISLLLLSRTMYLPDSLSTEEQLTKAILVLPQSVSQEASLKARTDTDKYDNKTKIDIIRQEQEAIRLEREAAKQEQKQLEQQKLQQKKQEELITLVDKAPTVVLEPADSTSKPATEKLKSGECISSADLAHIESAIECLESAKTALQEEDLDDLKEHALERDVLDAAERQQIGSSSCNKTHIRLDKKLESIIAELDGLVGRVGGISEEVKEASNITPAETGSGERMVQLGDLLGCLRLLRPGDSEARWLEILSVLDEDKDGRIEVRHVARLMDMLEGCEGELELSSREIARILDAFDKDQQLEYQQEHQQELPLTADQVCKLRFLLF